MFIRLVSTARKPSDTGRILAASRLSPKIPLVTLAMGEIGFPSRVLSTGFGAVYTYAAPAHVQGTAAGQVNARQLRSLYRIDKFTKAAKIFAVIADPVRQSVSPHVHNRAFQSRRIDAVYVPAAGERQSAARFLFSSRGICRFPDSASPSRTSGGSCGISIRWIRWRGASAR